MNDGTKSLPRAGTALLAIVSLVVPEKAADARSCPAAPSRVLTAAGPRVLPQGNRVPSATQSSRPESSSASGSVCSRSTQTLLSPSVQAGDREGWALARSGDTLLVAAPRSDERAFDAGAVHVWVRGAGGWTHQQTLLAPDGAPLDIFGRSVAIDGDVAVVGANFDDDLGSASGSAYVFTRTGTAWSFQAKLLPSDGQTAAGFGDSVAMQGSRIAVGSSSHDNAGTVYVFDWDGAAWRETARLQASDRVSGDRFGVSLALDGDRLLIGAFHDLHPWPGSGSAYVFEYSAGQWQESYKLLPSGSAAVYEFGLALSLEGDLAAVGSPWGTDGTGSVHLFRHNGTTWTEEATLAPDDGGFNDGFGAAVDMEGALILVGASTHDDPAQDAGAVYLFEQLGGLWMQMQKIVSPIPLEGAIFGVAVELQGNEAIVGAFFDDLAGDDSGATYAFELVPPPRAYCTSKLDSAGCLPRIGWTGSPSASSSTPFQVTAVDLRNQSNGLFFYGLSGRTAVPFQGGTLCLDGPFRRTPVRSSGGSQPPGIDCSGAFALDFNGWMASGADPRLGAGVTVQGQYWYRDPGAASGTGISDAIEFTVCD